MKKKPSEIVKFYNSLESLESLNIWNIQNELIESSKMKDEWHDNILTERKILSYNINKGQLISNVKITDIKGKIVETSIFSDKEIHYIKERLKETKNSWLLARYAHILWNLTKHNSFVEIAIDNYILNINRIKSDEINELSRFLSAILFLSKKTKHKTEKAKETALILLKELPNWFKSVILNSILENCVLSINELKKIADNALEWIDLSVKTSYSNNKDSLDVIEKLFNKIHRPTERVFELLAMNED